MFQQTILVGNLGRDPEMRYTPTGVPVTEVSLATSRVYTDSSGERQEKTIWWRIVFWRKTAETVANYLKKGSKILVEAEIEEPEHWIDKDGQSRAALKATGRSVKFLDSRRDGGSSNGNQRNDSEPPSYAANDEDIPF